MSDSLAELRERLRGFAAARDWEQFHTPKNLTAALAGEVGELVAILQWADGDAPLSDAQRAALRDEMADILIYLVVLGDACDTDVLQAAAEKIDRNERRFPRASPPERSC